jgi:hypothetical protein
MRGCVGACDIAHRYLDWTAAFLRFLLQRIVVYITEEHGTIRYTFSEYWSVEKILAVFGQEEPDG